MKDVIAIVDESAKSFATWGWVSVCFECRAPVQIAGSYLGDAPDVLVSVLLAEAKVLIQSKAHVIAIETVGGEAQVQQVLLERSCDSRLSRRRETGEPDGEAGLLAECVTLLTGEGRVPCDVAVDCQYSIVLVSRSQEWWDGGVSRGTHVAILM